MEMQRTELSEHLQEVLAESQRRVQVINYVLAVLLIITLVWAFYAAWRSSRQEKIESISLVPDSVKVIGPSLLCPGDTMTIAYKLDIEGVGVIIADDSVEYANRTVKFSQSLREIINQSGRRSYELAWKIPPKPEMAGNDNAEWMPGLYLRYISIAASNIYVSRYTDPVRFRVPFTIREDCERIGG